MDEKQRYLVRAAIGIVKCLEDYAHTGESDYTTFADILKDSMEFITDKMDAGTKTNFINWLQNRKTS